MEDSKEELFNSIGNITLQELFLLYGKDLMPADIVLKLAEHKNFDAAKKEFQKWDEHSVITMSNYLSQSFRHEMELYSTRDKYIAVSFLKELISKWDEDRLVERQPQLEDHLQAAKAEKLLKRRLSGVLPHIDLAGTDFTVDWRLKELRETDAPWNHIDLEYMEMSDSGEEYICLYDTEHHILYSPDENITELPKNVVMLEIPNELALDPVAVARTFEMNESTFLNDYPIQENLKATVKPLTDTLLPDIIAENLKTHNIARKRGR